MFRFLFAFALLAPIFAAACATVRLIPADFPAPIAVGDPAPGFKLLDDRENTIASEDLIVNGPAVLVFYRGWWCPWCRSQLGELSHEIEAFKARGATIVAISVDSTEDSRSYSARAGLKFPLLADPDGMLTRDYTGVEENGTGIPGVFIIGTDGLLIFSQVSDNMQDRLHAKDLLAIIDRAQASETPPPGATGGYRPVERAQATVGLAIASAQHGRDADAVLAGELGTSVLYPLGRYLLVGPAVRGVLSAAPVVDIGLAAKLRAPIWDDLGELYLTSQAGMSIPLRGDTTIGWHAGAYIGHQLALFPSWAPFLQMGLIYESMDGRPRRDGLRFSIELGVTFFL